MGRILGSSVQGKKSDDGTVDGVRNPGGRPSPETKEAGAHHTSLLFYVPNRVLSRIRVPLRSADMRSVIALFSIMLLVGYPAKQSRAQSGPPVRAMGSGAVFSGRVVRAPDGSPLAGSDVSLAGADRHVVTDSGGAFRVDGLPSGTQLVELRHVGFQARRDTVTLSAGTEVVRTYTLLAQTAQLDTVKTVSAGRKYTSPMLRAFEARRLSGQGGRFVSDSEFRKSENSTLANVLTRIPGVSLYRGQTLVSSRKACRGLAFQPKAGCVRGQPDCYVTIYLDAAMLYTARMADDGVSPPDDDDRAGESCQADDLAWLRRREHLDGD